MTSDDKGRLPSQPVSDYAKFRGRCKALSEAACAADPSLRLVRGHYFCPIWNRDEPHWWTVHPDGSIHDPSAAQFPSRGGGVYMPFDGVIECSQCAKPMREDAVRHFESRYAFCSDRCYGIFVGVLDVDGRLIV